MGTIYRNSIRYYGPYLVDGLKIYVIDGGDRTYLFHRESTVWAHIAVNMKVVDWGDFLLLNKKDLSHFLRRAKQVPNIEGLSSEFKPDALMLFPTERCNLRCLYCHCNSSNGQDMIPEIAYRAIDEYLAKYCNHRAHLSFMGGGEPTLNFALIKEVTPYFKNQAEKYKLVSSVNIVTNGCCSAKVTDWLLDNCDNVSVSFDGLPKLQDQQRPTATGEASWPLVERFFSYVGRKNRKVAVRATISFDALHLIDDIVNFCKNLPISRLQIEGIYKTGRARTLNFGGEERYENFFKAILSHHGVVRNSWLTPFACSNIFCSAPRGNFIVTSQGNISICTEISEKNDDISRYGLVGKVTKKGVRIDRLGFQRFQHKCKELLSLCDDCIVRYKCGGGCFSKRLRGYETDDPNLCKYVINAHLSLLLHTWEEIFPNENTTIKEEDNYGISKRPRSL